MGCRENQSRKSELVHVCLTADTRHTLDALAYERHETISELIREALGVYLANPPRAIRPPPPRPC